MKFYKVEVSGQLLAQFFSTHVLSDFNERITIENGVPPDAHLLQSRIPSPDRIEFLFATDEESDLPEAVDVWEWAQIVRPTGTRDWIEKESAA